MKFGAPLSMALSRFLDWKEARHEPVVATAPLILSLNAGRAATTRALQKMYARVARGARIAGHRLHVQSPHGFQPGDLRHAAVLVARQQEVAGRLPREASPFAFPFVLSPSWGNWSGPAARTAVRAYWRNNSFNANVTYDVPHESRLEPHEWGTALVE